MLSSRSFSHARLAITFKGARMTQSDQIPKADPSVSNNRERRFLDCYERGMHLALHEKDYDYAHLMFAECVLHDPGNLQFVESMVQNLRARTPCSGKSRFKLYRGGSRSLKKAFKTRNWAGVFRIGLDLLKIDPWDVTTLRTMADACAGLHHNEVELVYLKQALDAEPKNLEVSRHCARSLGRMGQFDQAIACWHRVEKLAGKDGEAARMISMLAEEKLKYPGGRPPSVQNKQAGVKVEQVAWEKEPAKDVVFSPEQTLEQAISHDPTNVGNYLELAGLLLESERFTAAEMVLSRAIVACGEQQSLVDQLNRVRCLRAEDQRRLDEERSVEQQKADAPIRIPWLELTLGLAMVLLILQSVPAARVAAWRIIDFREWSRIGWFVFNIMVLLGLVAVRYGSEIRKILVRKKVRGKFRAASHSQ